MTYQDQSNLTETGRAAVAYAQRGWHVFPVKAGTKGRDANKKSTHHLTNGHNGASDDPDQVARWWTQWPDANIGLHLAASGLVALDPDTYKDDCEWHEFVKGRDLPDTLVQRSARGGKHYLFTAPSEEKFPGHLCPGVEIKHKGYIMLEPSTFEGGQYEFETDDDPAPVPEWVPRVKPKLSQRAAPAAGFNIDTGGHHPPAMAEVADALSYISADLPYDEWCSVLMALHDEFGADGLSLADDWSATGSTYEPGEVEKKFRSFNPGGGITIRYVFKLAKDNGCDMGELSRKHRPAMRKARAEAFKANPPDISPAALRLASRITKGIMRDLPDLTDEPFVDPLIIRDMIEGAFWSGAKSKLFLLNEAENLIQFSAAEAWRFLCRRFGSPVDADEIVTRLGDMKPNEEQAARKAISAATIGPVIDHLKYHNQRDAIAWQVDMFGDRARLELQEDVARIVLTHHPAPMGGTYTPALVADYKAHFPELDSVIEFVVASRFALDRKKSFLWMLADSDWGKGFFLGVLESLGLVVQMSIKEIEAVFEGKPAGKSPADFKRAMILAVDEFKVVKSELKQLQSEIPLAPKYQLTSRVEVFTKLFLSAENVGSLVGEHGVEDQFANRMSMITGRGSMLSRSAYEADRGRYFRSCKAYVAQEINRLVEAYRAEGREGAERRADKFLTEFITRHGLGQHFKRLSESIEEIADEAVAYFRESAPGYLVNDGAGGCYLPHPGKRLQDYLEERFEKAEVATLRRRKDEILRAMSADGRGAASHRAERRNVKAVKLKA